MIIKALFSLSCQSWNFKSILYALICVHLFLSILQRLFKIKRANKVWVSQCRCELPVGLVSFLLLVQTWMWLRGATCCRFLLEPPSCRFLPLGNRGEFHLLAKVRLLLTVQKPLWGLPPLFCGRWGHNEKTVLEEMCKTVLSLIHHWTTTKIK